MVKNGDMTQASIELSSLFLFDGIDASTIARLTAALPPPEEFRRGEAVYTETSFRRALGVVLSGELTVRRLGADGRQQHRLVPGSLFGAAALYGGETFVTDVTAARRSRVQFLPEDVFTAWFYEDGRIAERYIRFLTDRVRFLNRQLGDCTGGSAEERLWQYLRERSDADGRVILAVPWNTVAEQLGMGRSSLYRARDRLVSAGRLRLCPDNVVILPPLADKKKGE